MRTPQNARIAEAGKALWIMESSLCPIPTQLFLGQPRMGTPNLSGSPFQGEIPPSPALMEALPKHPMSSILSTSNTQLMKQDRKTQGLKSLLQHQASLAPQTQIISP